MLHLLNPIWLLAIGAIIIPLAIHLWNVKKGKTLKIGSIQLLGESSKQNARSLRFQDLWLLLLRCLLFIVLALILAAPHFVQKATAEKVKGWILLDKNNRQESYQAFKPSIDSLAMQGFQTRYFNPGFKEFKLSDTSKMEWGERHHTASQVSYWSLVKALDDLLPVNSSVYIYTSNRLNRFKGNRPLIKSNITWKTYSPADSVFNKISAAYLTQKDSLRLILAQSIPTGMSYSAENTSVEEVNPAYEFPNGDKNRIRFNSAGIFNGNIDSSAVAIDTTVMRIALFTDKYPADLAYLKAALGAVQSFSQRRISVTTYRDPNKIPAGLNWIFWLSEATINNKTAAGAENIFSYQPGKALVLNKSSILTNAHVPFDLRDIGLYLRKPANNLNPRAEALWEDETGGPVLTRFETGKSSEFKFYSRFDPEWNDLVWSSQFPEALLELVIDRQKETTEWNISDRRTLATSQIMPAKINSSGKSSDGIKTHETYLSKYLWILFLLLFGLERWVSHTQKSMTENG